MHVFMLSDLFANGFPVWRSTCDRVCVSMVYILTQLYMQAKNTAHRRGSHIVAGARPRSTQDGSGLEPDRRVQRECGEHREAQMITRRLMREKAIAEIVHTGHDMGSRPDPTVNWTMNLSSPDSDRTISTVFIRTRNQSSLQLATANFAIFYSESLGVPLIEFVEIDASRAIRV